MIKYIGVIFFIILYSCKQPATESFTYFGGQIINPKIDYVYLVKDGIAIDSSLLDVDNKFLFKIKISQEGLFHFKHGNEFQYLYLEPKDSVIVRLNTWDFDESIAFVGKGAEKNNFLIHLFLINELEDEKFFPFYQLDYQTFSYKIDSTIAAKEVILSKFKKSNQNLSKGFLQVADAGIQLSTLRKKENYAYGHKKLLNLPEYPLIDADFYQYRKDLNLNDSTLIYYHPYQNYLHSYIYYKASIENKKDSLNRSFSLIALQSIDHQFKNKTIKNLMLKQTLVESFLKNTPCLINESEFDFYNKTTSNIKDKNRILKLHNDSKSLTNNGLLDNFLLINAKKQSYYVNSLIENRNAVLYFWSPATMSDEYLIARIQFLETQFPSLLFIGINTDSRQKSIERIQNLPLKNHFFLPDNSLGKKHVSSNFPRVILINRLGNIENSFTYLASKQLNQQLADLEKK